MATYASRTALKWLLLTINSVNFIIGTFIVCQGAVMLIGVGAEFVDTSNTLLDNSISESNEDLSNSSNDGEGDKSGHIPFGADRFPSVASPGGVFLFGLLITLIGGLGAMAVSKEDIGLLNTYSYASIICCFIKFLFIFATIQMHALNYSYDPIGGLPVLVGICIGILELVLGMCACQLAKILKRGDAAEPRIEALPEKV